MNKFIKYLGCGFLYLIVSFNLFAMELEENIVDVDINEELLDEKGLFKDSEAVITFIIEAAKEGRLPEKFQHIKFARKLEKEHRISRFWTEQLYEVLCEDRTAHVIKGIFEKEKNKDEAKAQIRNLQSACKDSRLEGFVFPYETSGLQFIFPRHYLRYSNKGEEHFLEILPKGQGQVLHEIITEFVANTSPEIVQLAGKAYFDIGYSLAKFYKSQGTLDNTIIHWSLHGSNMLYDSKTRMVILIDNDVVIKSLEKPTHVGRDMATLFALSPYIINFTFENFLEQLDLTRWYTITLTSFLFGFLSTYEQSERKDIFIKLKDLLLKWDTYFNKKDIKKAKKAIKNVLIKNPENENNLESQYIEQGKSELEIIEQNPDLEILKYFILND